MTDGLLRRATAALLAATTAFSPTVGGIATPSLLVPAHSAPAPKLYAVDGGWLDIGRVVQTSEIVRPETPRYIGVIGGHEDAARNDWELDQYLAGNWWCGDPCPGDVIELVGEFNATRTFQKNASTPLRGTAGNPILFKSTGSTWNGSTAAKVTGGWTLPGVLDNPSAGVYSYNASASSSRLFFWGLKFCKKSSQDARVVGNRGYLTIGGDYNTIRRSEFTEWDRSVCVTFQPGRGCLLDYCEFHDPMDWITTASYHPRNVVENGKGTNIYSASPDEIPLRMGIRITGKKYLGTVIPESWCYGFKIRHTRFYNFPKKPVVGNYNSGQGDPIEVGGDQIDYHGGGNLTKTEETVIHNGISYRRIKSINSYINADWLLEYLLFDNLQTDSAAFMDVKAAGVNLKKVTVEKSAGSLSFRTTCFSSMEDIYVDGGQGISSHGFGHSFNRIQFVSRAATPDGFAKYTPTLRLVQGGKASKNPNPSSNANAADLLIGAGHMASQSCIVRQFRGTLKLGEDPGWDQDFPAMQCEFYNCTPTPTVSDTAMRAFNTFNGQAASQTVTKLTTSDAGLSATYVD